MQDRWPADRVERRKVVDLIPYARNARTHSDEQVAQIAASIREWGWTTPVLIDEASGIIAGHGRVMAARKLGLTDVPVMVAAGWSEAQKRAYVLADNKLALNAGWNDELLALELGEIGALGFDVGLIGFDHDDKALNTGPADTVEDAPEQLPGAAALKQDMKFASVLPWNIPEIRSDLVPEIPDYVQTWAGPDASDDDGHSLCLWQWRSDSLRSAPRDRLIAGFYVDDSRFDCLWDEPEIYVAKLINLGIRMAIAPNYSIWSDSPRAVQLWAVYRARWVARYFQEAGIAVIPDLNWSDDQSFDYCLLGVPKNPRSAAVQIQTVRSTREMKACISGLKRCVSEVAPEKLLIYGGPIADEIIEAAALDVSVVRVQSRTAKRRVKIERDKEMLIGNGGGGGGGSTGRGARGRGGRAAGRGGRGRGARAGSRASNRRGPARRR
jgi:hypothetical protein